MVNGTSRHCGCCCGWRAGWLVVSGEISALSWNFATISSFTIKQTMPGPTQTSSSASSSSSSSILLPQNSIQITGKRRLEEPVNAELFAAKNELVKKKAKLIDERLTKEIEPVQKRHEQLEAEKLALFTQLESITKKLFQETRDKLSAEVSTRKAGGDPCPVVVYELNTFRDANLSFDTKQTDISKRQSVNRSALDQFLQCRPGKVVKLVDGVRAISDILLDPKLKSMFIDVISADN